MSVKVDNNGFPCGHSEDRCKAVAIDPLKVGPCSPYRGKEKEPAPPWMSSHIVSKVPTYADLLLANSQLDALISRYNKKRYG